MSDNSRELRLVLKNEIAELARLADAIDEFAGQSEFPEKERFELQLCLEEIFTNIVNYGFEDIEEHEIQVDFRLDSRTGVLDILIVDDGIKFDPLSDSPEPTLDARLEDRPIGGLGIHLVQKFVDRVEYDHQNGRNHLKLMKKLASRESVG